MPNNSLHLSRLSLFLVRILSPIISRHTRVSLPERGRAVCANNQYAMIRLIVGASSGTNANRTRCRKHALTLQLHTAHILSAHASLEQKGKAIQDIREQKNKCVAPWYSDLTRSTGLNEIL
jgi:hypothetical protein